MSNTRAEQALSACGGAAITSLFVTPLDVVKVRMQAPAATLQSCEHPTCAGTSSSSVMMRVARHEGVGMLWAGLQPALVMSVPGTVIYFACYEATRDAITACWPRLGESAPLLAGGGARLLTATVVSPVELMRTRMQAEQALLREGMVGGAAALVRREGYGALWKGLSATLWRDVPFSCLCAPQPLAPSSRNPSSRPPHPRAACSRAPSLGPNILTISLALSRSLALLRRVRRLVWVRRPQAARSRCGRRAVAS